MKIHEYQAKDLFSQSVCFPSSKAMWLDRLMKPLRPSKRSAKSLAVVKAQIHAGGRGKRNHHWQHGAARRATGTFC